MPVRRCLTTLSILAGLAWAEPETERVALPVSDSVTDEVVVATLQRLGWTPPEEEEIPGWSRRNGLFRSSVLTWDLGRTIEPGIAAVRPGTEAQGTRGSGERRLSFRSLEGWDRPALEWFLANAVVQESRRSMAYEEGEWLPVQPIRSGSGLLVRTLVSSRWALAYVESGTPLALDVQGAELVTHGTAWVADVFLWSLTGLFVSVPGLEAGERMQVAAFSIGIGAAGRLLVGGIPLASALGFRNALMAGPYRWPARDHRGRPWPRD